MNDPLMTSVVGSYPQPGWLVDRDRLGTFVPRVRVPDVWRLGGAALEAAQDDATELAIRDMERAGVDIVSDGEIRRESYSNRFATALEGVDIETPGEVISRNGKPTPVPRVVGPIGRPKPILVDDLRFIKARTDRLVKMTVPGPFTLSMQAQDEHYGDSRALAMAYADVVAEEVRDLFAAGADVVQLDEPWMQARPEQAREYAVDAINRALGDAEGVTAVHMCFGYAQTVKDKPSGYSFLSELAACAATQISIEAAQPELDLEVLGTLRDKQVLVGVISMGTQEPETPECVASRIRKALEVLPPERLVVAPDCGMKYLPRAVAFAKLAAMVDGARQVRAALGI